MERYNSKPEREPDYEYESRHARKMSDKAIYYIMSQCQDDMVLARLMYELRLREGDGR